MDTPQQCVSIGYSSAMFWGRVCLSSLLMFGIAQQSKIAAYSSAKYLDSVHFPPMYWNRVNVCNVGMYRVDLGVRVLTWDKFRLSVKGVYRLYKTVSVLWCATGALFVRRCIIMACRARPCRQKKGETDVKLRRS